MEIVRRIEMIRGNKIKRKTNYASIWLKRKDVYVSQGKRTYDRDMHIV